MISSDRRRGGERHQAVADYGYPDAAGPEEDEQRREARHGDHPEKRQDRVGDETERESDGRRQYQDARLAGHPPRARSQSPPGDVGDAGGDKGRVVGDEGDVRSGALGGEGHQCGPAPGEDRDPARAGELPGEEQRARQVYEGERIFPPGRDAALGHLEKEVEHYRRCRTPPEGRHLYPEGRLRCRGGGMEKGVRKRPEGETEAEQGEHPVEPRPGIDREAVDAEVDVHQEREKGKQGQWINIKRLCDLFFHLLTKTSFGLSNQTSIVFAVIDITRIINHKLDQN